MQSHMMFLPSSIHDELHNRYKLAQKAVRCTAFLCVVSGMSVLCLLAYF